MGLFSKSHSQKTRDYATLGLPAPATRDEKAKLRSTGLSYPVDQAGDAYRIRAARAASAKTAGMTYNPPKIEAWEHGQAAQYGGAAKKPAAKKPAAKKPSVKKPSVKKPSVKKGAKK